jgi:hypothetical protein
LGGVGLVGMSPINPAKTAPVFVYEKNIIFFIKNIVWAEFADLVGRED